MTPLDRIALMRDALGWHGGRLDPEHTAIDALERIALRLGYSSGLAGLDTPTSVSRDLCLLAAYLGVEQPLEHIGGAHRDGLIVGKLSRQSK